MTTKDFFSKLTLIFFGLVSGQLILAGVGYFLNQQGAFSPNQEFQDIMEIIIPLAALASVGGATFLTRGLIAQIPKDSSLEKKLNQYRNAVIIKIALYEGVSILAIVAYMLTGQWLFLAVSLTLIAVQLTIAPNPNKAIDQLGLVGEEKSILQSEDGLIT